MLKGIAASHGIAIGRAYVIKEEKVDIKRIEITDIDNQKSRLRKAIETAADYLEELKKRTEEKLGADKGQIFEAHLFMLQDPEFINAIEMKIDDEKVAAEYAVNETVAQFVAIFESMDNDYMRERAADIKDVGGRLLNILLNRNNPSISEIDEECIVIVKDLTPSDTAQMDKEKVLGFVTEIGGRTSHSAIMARSLEIPAVVGVKGVTASINHGDMLIIDGENGEIIINPDKETISNYTKKKEEIAKTKKELELLKELESVTVDGRVVEIAGNIGNPQDAERVMANGGEGVGLFRTEFLYMSSDTLPTEEQQFTAYKEALLKMKGNPVIIRTLDIGGDKHLSYLPIDDEMNPFLGYRAIRLCLDRKDIFKTQLRALFRASVYGKLKIMFPMVSGYNEIMEAKKIVNEVKKELDNENIPYSHDVEIGIMIEIPSAAIMSDILAKEVDFFSIGTNDLIQYTIAVDRMNEKISYLYDPFNPAVLRLIKLVIDNAHRAGKWVGVCGEMAGDLRVIPLLLGMGLDEFSMSASSILKARKLIRSLNYEDTKKMVEDVLKLSSGDEVKKYIEENV
ncbi:phosphoenolpyruvate-protein phosphotransferase [Fervidicella metallireducens AeB]|uniref:Phosphoenolpyruvate-protein phosphotransferase n=1 Tax=Fervidicella metallireducens AeB TaxID=1403537 RepID=A0A017RXM0_9CLOT|nr:phosphoenolpyruvate--protein phosphotransferase [Fervidicella metallireducens]EYE89139.1 phosphoenolpyruvate-protein phosphotransferase [Fervidicella metallireducens AeB]